MGRKAKLKAKRNAETRELEEQVAVLKARAAFMRSMALKPVHLVDVTSGESLFTKEFPANANGDVGMLRTFCAHAVMIPGWSTHLVLGFARERVPADIGHWKIIHHLSVTFHIDGQWETAELQPHKDAFVRKTIAPEMLEWFFPDGADLYIALNASEPVTDNEGINCYTPITLHFYVDELADKPERPEPKPQVGDLVPTQVTFTDPDGESRTETIMGRVVDTSKENS